MTARRRAFYATLTIVLLTAITVGVWIIAFWVILQP